MKKKWLHAIRNSGNVVVNRSRLNCETANNEIRKQRQLVTLELMLGSFSNNDGDSYKTSLKREFALLQIKLYSAYFVSFNSSKVSFWS